MPAGAVRAAPAPAAGGTAGGCRRARRRRALARATPPPRASIAERGLAPRRRASSAATRAPARVVVRRVLDHRRQDVRPPPGSPLRRWRWRRRRRPPRPGRAAARSMPASTARAAARVSHPRLRQRRAEPRLDADRRDAGQPGLHAVGLAGRRSAPRRSGLARAAAGPRLWWTISSVAGSPSGRTVRSAAVELRLGLVEAALPHEHARADGVGGGRDRVLGPSPLVGERPPLPLRARGQPTSACR